VSILSEAPREGNFAADILYLQRAVRIFYGAISFFPASGVRFFVGHPHAISISISSAGVLG